MDSTSDLKGASLVHGYQNVLRSPAGPGAMGRRPHSDRGIGLELRFRGTLARARRLRRHSGRDRAPRGDDAGAGGRVSAGLQVRRPTTISSRSIPPACGTRACAIFRRAGSPRPAGREDRRGAGRAGQARRRAPAAAGGRPLLLLAARHHAGNAPPRQLVGRPHGRDQRIRCEEKMALFWHGHFATGEEKVRDYRKMEQQLALFHRHATGNFRELLIEVARDPAMLAYLDAAREREGRAQRELRPRGDGTLHHGRRQLYREGHPRGGARLHRLDRRRPRLQGRSGKARRRAEDLPRPHRQFRRRRYPRRIILEQKVTAEYIAGKLYRYFVREDISPAMQAQARRRAARQRLRDRAAAAHHLPVAGLLQRAVVRHPHQGADRARRLDLSQARRASACRAFPISTSSAANSGRSCSIRRRSPAGPRAAPGSRRGCCWRAAISPATCCSPTS